jgi:hypothetical protein
MSSTKVRFVESESGVLSFLEVKSSRRKALFPKIAASLFVLRVQIVHAHSRLSGRSRVDRLSVVELDGAPISARRRLQIQHELLSSIDGGLAPPPRPYLTRSSPALNGRAPSLSRKNVAP